MAERACATGGLRSPHDLHDLRILSVHKEVAASEKSELAEAIELVRTERSHEDLGGREGVEVSSVDLRPVLLCELREHDIECRVIVPNQDVAIVHRGWIHVRAIPAARPPA